MKSRKYFGTVCLFTAWFLLGFMYYTSPRKNAHEGMKDHILEGNKSALFAIEEKRWIRTFSLELTTEEWLDKWSKTIGKSAFDHPVVYNRVNKCGSGTMLKLIGLQSERNRFNYTSFIQRMPDRSFYWNSSYQSQISRKIAVNGQERIFKFLNRAIHVQHSYFSLNLTWVLPMVPLFINLIRDPVSRIESLYKWKNIKSENFKLVTGGNDFELCLKHHFTICQDFGGDRLPNTSDVSNWWIPHELLFYFCGPLPSCYANLEHAYKGAVENINKHYLSVGIAEYYNETLEMLEFLLPEYFSGVLSLEIPRVHDLKFTKLTPESRAVLEKRLEVDYRFYNAVKRRFWAQYKLITKLKEAGMKTRLDYLNSL